MRRAAFLAACLATSALAGRADAVPIRVRGETNLRLVAFAQDGAAVVRGEVVDDVGASMPGARVDLELPRVAGRVAWCGEGGNGQAEGNGRRVALRADDRGAFCARIEGLSLGDAVAASVAGSDLFDGARSKANVDGDATGLVKTSIRFESPSDDVDLDRDAVKLTATLGVDRADAERLAAGAVKRQGLALSVEDERGVEVARAKTGGDGRARFEIATSSLAGPGEGTLRVRFAGNTSLQPASTTLHVNRSARVTLQIAAAPPAGDGDDGIPLEVSVTTGRGPVTGGVVEAHVAGLAVGAATVREGRATIIVAVPGRRPGPVLVTLRFVTAAPWFVPGPELPAEVIVRPPSPIGLVALFALVAAVGGWVLSRWRRPPKPKELEVEASPKPPGHAEVLVVASHRGGKGWRGRVIDAHDGTPVVGAEVVIARPSFDGDGVLARIRTDEAGAFVVELAGTEPSTDATLRVDGELHAAIEQVLPGPGELRISLVTRRRALLDRLVRWARTKGAPWDGAREPTPGHVRRLAARSEAGEIADWAGSVEAAAFGAATVDRAAEEEVRAREPGPQAR